MLVTERLLVSGERYPRQRQCLRRASAGDKRRGEIAAQPVCPRVIRAVEPPRFRHQVLAGEDGARLLVLQPQGVLEGFSGYASQRDQVFADAAAGCFLARYRRVDVGAGNQALGQQ